MELEQLRRDYESEGLDLEQLCSDPFDQLELWLQQAVESGMIDPNAMSLATVDRESAPWQRTVLLKHFDHEGLVFYTNTGSRKAKEIAANARVSLLFPWFSLNRQVTVGGVAEKLPIIQVIRYFASRPRDSQIAAWASAQSNPLSSRRLLEEKFAEMKYKFAKREVPLPSFWGGYRVIPDSFEFWQGRRSRLHDRFMYRKSPDGNWLIERLAP